MIIIEFFGPPCSGKTSGENYLLKKNKNFISSNILIPKYSKNFIKLTTLDKASLKYMQLVKFLKKINTSSKAQPMISRKNNLTSSLPKGNRYSNFILKNYRKICKDLYKLYSKKNYELNKFYLNNLNKIRDKKLKSNYQNWFEETSAKYYIAKNLKDKKKVVIFDEGLLQRSYFICYQKNNFRNKLNYYLQHVDKPDYAIYLDMDTKSLLKRSNFRKSQEKNMFVYKNLKDIKRYKVFFKYILKKLN